MSDLPIGAVVRIWAEYVFPDGTAGIQPFYVPLSEWKPDVGDQYVRQKFAELADNMRAKYPAAAAEIAIALASLSAPDVSDETAPAS